MVYILMFIYNEYVVVFDVVGVLFGGLEVDVYVYVYFNNFDGCKIKFVDILIIKIVIIDESFCDVLFE